MDDDSNQLAARVEALEDIVLGLMCLAVQRDPTLRQKITRELQAAADDAGDREAEAVREAIKTMAASFNHQP